MCRTSSQRQVVRAPGLVYCLDVICLRVCVVVLVLLARKVRSVSLQRAGHTVVFERYRNRGIEGTSQRVWVGNLHVGLSAYLAR